MNEFSGDNLNRSLAVSFGVASFMWLCSYIAMLQPGFFWGEILWILAVMALPIGGWYVSRWENSSLKSAFFVGAASSLINLLILGSLIGNRFLSMEKVFIANPYLDFILLIIIFVFIGVALSSLGFFISHKIYKKSKVKNNPSWLSFFSAIAALITFFMLISGGVVTGLEAGLAVPDWPNSYGHNMLLYPLAEMTSDLEKEDESLGIYYEHAHRLIGMLVGLTVLVLCIRIWRSVKGPVRILGVLAFLIVCFQGLLGGLRVTETNTFLGIIHGILGQIFFALLVLITMFLSTFWRTKKHINAPVSKTDKNLVALLLLFVLIQLFLGASYRQMSSDNSFSSQLVMGFLHGHIANSILVVFFSIFLGVRLISMSGYYPFCALGKSLCIFLAIQFIGGLVALLAVLSRDSEQIPILELLFTSIHQSSGALFLTIIFISFVWIWKDNFYRIKFLR